VTVREKIQRRLDDLEAKLQAGEHLDSVQGLIGVLVAIDSVSKLWRVLTDEERDFLHAARLAVEEEREWS
jgi:hypothetical protein